MAAIPNKFIQTEKSEREKSKIVAFHNLIKTLKLRDPMKNFGDLIKNKLDLQALQRRLQLANLSRYIIEELDLGKIIPYPLLNGALGGRQMRDLLSWR